MRDKIKKGTVNENKEENKKQNKIKILHMNKYFRLSLIVFLSLALPVLGCFMYIREKKYKYIDQEVHAYSYTNKACVNYEVFLIENPIYPMESLGEGNIYVGDLIDYINTVYKYEFIGDSSCEVNGKYDIIGILEGRVSAEEGYKVLWQKEYILQPETVFNENNKTVSIEQKIPIDIKTYKDFNDLAATTLKMNFKTMLTIYWNTSMEAQTDKGLVKEKFSCVMEIPVVDKYFEVAGNLTQQKNGSLKETEKIISPSYEKIMTLSKVGCIFCAVLLLFIIVFTAKVAQIGKLEKVIKQIFKNHGSRMVASFSEVPAVSNVVIEVSSIDDLVKIADDVGRPILYRNRSNVGEITSFYVIGDSVIYLLDVNKVVSNNLVKDTVFIKQGSASASDS